MDKQNKVVVSIRIDPEIKDLCEKLKIDKALVAERAFKLEIQKRLKLLRFDKMDARQGLAGYLQEEKILNESVELASQRLEQDEYARVHEAEIKANLERNLLLEYRNFCNDNNIPETPFSSFLLGDTNYPNGLSHEEHLSQYLSSKGLSSDINLLRPLLMKTPMKVVVR
jgi:hypothetical protein